MQGTTQAHSARSDHSGHDGGSASSRTSRRRAPALLAHRLGRAELVLAALVIAIVAMMIVPLPTWLLDLLLATNLSASVAILLVVLYVPDALSIATFPTLLLLTTLFRLALNVSTSRLILLQANAGEVIRAFGSFVVRGNYVVGGVVFLILTIIQFVVIAKGSERVAEVGARFVLDALPGKQMAIDAEVRSGAIDGNEARRRRHKLARESQFYGAMDGAMKFVKGDVIASLVITIVNILGGLAIGVAQRDMAVVDALKRYGLLTIGDGLVSQIPALVLSTAAGVLVTRVASEAPGTSLGEELARQLLGFPKALRAAGAFILVLAALPGLPALPFLLIACALFVIAQVRTNHLAREERRARAEPLPEPSGARKDPSFLPIVVPWSVEVSDDLGGLVDPEGYAADDLRAALSGLREQVFAELGVPLPTPRVRSLPGLSPRSVTVSLFEVPAQMISVPPHLGGPDAVAFVREATRDLLRRRCSDFLGLAEVQRMLDELEQFAPATVRNVVPKPVSLTLLTEVLRRLVEERLSIRDLRAVLEALATSAPTEKDPLNLTELVRAHLRRALTFQLTHGAPHLGVVLVDPAIEDTLRRAITKTSSGSFLALAPAASRDVVTALKRAATEAAQEPGARLVFLTQPDIRRFIRKLIEAELPEATVVTFAELLPEVVLRPLARANLVGLGA